MTTPWNHPNARHEHERHPVWLDAQFRTRPDGRPYPAAITSIFARGAVLQARFRPNEDGELWLDIFWNGPPLALTAVVVDSVAQGDSVEVEVAFTGGDGHAKTGLQSLLDALAARAAGRQPARRQASSPGVRSFRV